MKPGPKLSPDRLYADKVGMSKRAIKRRGGTVKLHLMDPDAQKVIMADHNYGNSQTIHKGGLRARGMTHGAWPVVPTQFGTEAKIEAEIQKILKARGLLTSALTVR